MPKPDGVFLEINAQYIYVTEVFDEYKSRPDERYAHTLYLEIARPNERNEERIIVECVALIYVMLGKTAYKGVLNKQ